MENLRQKAIEVANTNPDAGLIYAILDMAQAIRENGCDLENIAKHQEQLAVNIGGVAEAINNVSSELVK